MYFKKEKVILIVDDSEPNRSLLCDILGPGYKVLEAEDGEAAVRELELNHQYIDLMLLDVMMPKMDGFDVLRIMNEKEWGRIPVILISSDTTAKSINKGYELGASDYISRPFNHNIVKRRVENTLMLFQKQKDLTALVKKQVGDLEQSRGKMISILSTAVEFRNGESGRHVIQIRLITERILERMMIDYPQYRLTPMMISNIVNASALHDIGKIRIPEKILNKPGKLTSEEFEVIKEHSLKGQEILCSMDDDSTDEMIEYGKIICQWHHERFDGKGYPDGLSGNEIPIAAQVVAIADVYDALVSERVYKPAFLHDEAVNMIINGECGAFNPDVMDCFLKVSKKLQKIEMQKSEFNQSSILNPELISHDMILRNTSSVSNRTINLVEEERIKYQFLASLSSDALFDYDAKLDTLIFTGESHSKLGFPHTIENLKRNQKDLDHIAPDLVDMILNQSQKTTMDNPFFQQQQLLTDKSGNEIWNQITGRTLWQLDTDGNPVFQGVIGKIEDINKQKIEMTHLRELATHDPLTKLYNAVSARELANQQLKLNKNDRYTAFLFYDVDNFKGVNDSKGHAYGDEVLEAISEAALTHTRSDDICARIGGDEFLIVLNGLPDIEQLKRQVNRVYQVLNDAAKEYEASISMGVSYAPAFGVDYDTLLHKSDIAMYESKRSGKQKYMFFDASMKSF